MSLALVAALGALVLGPVLYRFSRTRPWLHALLDGFLITSIGGLVLIELLPPAVGAAGGAALAAAIAGLAAPMLGEKLGGIAEQRAHRLALVLGLVALLAHAGVDGMALSGTGDHHHGHAAEVVVDTGPTEVDDGHAHEAHAGHGHAHAVAAPADGALATGGDLALAVILHRIPVSLAIWMLTVPLFGRRAAIGVLLAVGASTVAGFELGGRLFGVTDSATFAVFSAFVAGSLVHVIFHGAGGAPAGLTTRTRRVSELAGALSGAALVASLHFGHQHGPSTGFGDRLLDLSLESAPALLLGFTLAGVFAVALPRASLSWLGRGSRAAQAARGVVFGIPIPICSCGVVPLYRSLVQRGVPPAAGMAFLVATPELGVESVLLTVPLLGLPMMWARLIAAAVVAMLAGWLVSRMAQAPPHDPAADALFDEAASAGERVRRGVRYALVDVVDDTASWLLLGLLIAAAIDPASLGGLLDAIPAGLDVALFALIGMPIYVCASGATPMAAALLLVGASPGAALAFLLAGPATNVTTFGLLSQLHSRRVAFAFAVSVVGGAIVAGYVTNLILGVDYAATAGLHAEHEHGWIAWSSLAIVCAVFAGAIIRQGPRAFVATVLPVGDHDHDHDHDHGHGHGHDHGHDHGHHDHGHDHGHHDHGHHDHGHHDHGHHDHAPDPPKPAPSCGSGGCCG